MALYLEDFTPGQVLESPPWMLTKNEMVDFAKKYDPQPFHIDEAAATKSIYGGLLASGWQTIGIMMRLMWDTFLSRTASLGSPGCDEIRWLKPVRPGDTLRARFTITEVVPSRSKPDRGIVRTFSEILNQHDEVVMTVRGLGMFGRDPGGPRNGPPDSPPALVAPRVNRGAPR